jgi:hypothetical protein
VAVRSTSVNGPVVVTVYDNVADPTDSVTDAGVGERLDSVRHTPERRDRRGRARRVRARLLDALAVLVVLAALLAPNRLRDLTPWVFLRLPIEAIAAAALLLVLPRRAGRVLALLAGAALGVLTIGKILDMGFYEVLVRPFDPVLDWAFVGDGVEFLNTSFGRAGATAAVAAAALLGVAVLTGTALAALRLARFPVAHPDAATRTIAALTALWAGFAALGLDTTPDQPVAARSAAVPAYDRALQVAASLRDKAAFARQEGADDFAGTPGSELLTALRGKNVLLVFVESYGRSAIEDPGLAPTVVPVLESGTQRLRAAGFGAKSAFLTSPTVGGGSWFAHSTLLSGLWVDNQQRYQTLVSSDRFTLDDAFRRAGWRTVGLMPGINRPWPEGAFFGLDKVYNALQVGYRGPRFGWASMPDQYTLEALQRLELGRPGHPPVLAEIPLVSSHTPWAPWPKLVGWNQLGDGSIFDPIAAGGTSASHIWPDASNVRAAYAQSIAYSLSALISYLLTYGDKNTVVVFLGDHQPAPIVTGDGASRDVPITILARDPAVLARVAAWGWQDGLEPAPASAVWRMDAFRDRFLTAFGSARSPGSVG